MDPTVPVRESIASFVVSVTVRSLSNMMPAGSIITSIAEGTVPTPSVNVGEPETKEMFTTTGGNNTCTCTYVPICT